jgi:hypothetical protein
MKDEVGSGKKKKLFFLAVFFYQVAGISRVLGAAPDARIGFMDRNICSRATNAVSLVNRQFAEKVAHLYFLIEFPPHFLFLILPSAFSCGLVQNEAKNAQRWQQKQVPIGDRRRCGRVHR